MEGRRHGYVHPVRTPTAVHPNSAAGERFHPQVYIPHGRRTGGDGLSPVLFFVYGDSQPGHEKYPEEPQKESQPIDGIPVSEEQEFHRGIGDELRREKKQDRRGDHSEGQKYFLPSVQYRVLTFG